MKTLAMTTLALALTAAAPAAAHEDPEMDELAPASAHRHESAPCAPAQVEPPRELRDVGWAHSRRAPIYVNLMMLGEGFVEDDGNRLTTRDTQTLEGFGGLMRIGGVVDLHSRVGIRMQSFVRPTKKVLSDDPVDPTLTDEPWGAVMFGYVGPEYLYTTDTGVYFAGSVGFAGVASQDDVDRCDGGDCDDDDLENGSLGGALMASVGFEWRANKWFAVNTEAFGGVYRGVDDDERSMTDAVFGLGVGVGF